MKAPEIGLLASIGYSEIKIYKKPVVGLVSTGNELVDVLASRETSLLKSGKIRDSNKIMLKSLLQPWA